MYLHFLYSFLGKINSSKQSTRVHPTSIKMAIKVKKNSHFYNNNLDYCINKCNALYFQYHKRKTANAIQNNRPLYFPMSDGNYGGHSGELTGGNYGDDSQQVFLILIWVFIITFLLRILVSICECIAEEQNHEINNRINNNNYATTPV